MRSIMLTVFFAMILCIGCSKSNANLSFNRDSPQDCSDSYGPSCVTCNNEQCLTCSDSTDSIDQSLGICQKDVAAFCASYSPSCIACGVNGCTKCSSGEVDNSSGFGVCAQDFPDDSSDSSTSSTSTSSGY